jgi:hypothetical protein
MTDTEQIQIRVEIITGNIFPPRCSDPGEIDSTLHDAAIALVDCGGSQVLDNAIAVLAGVVATWPENLRPSPSEVAKQAAWVTRQDPWAILEPKGTADALARRIEAAIAGRLVAVPWPWSRVGGLTNALLPGAVTLLCGQAGATKSFMLNQAALWWIGEGWRTTLYELEEAADFWQNRALALLSGIGATTDPGWIHAHPERARALLIEHRHALDNFATVLSVAPELGTSLTGLAAWIEERAATGFRVIIADPLAGAVEESDKPWKEAQAFMLRVKRAAAKYGASVILATHPKGAHGKPAGPPSLDSLAGGRAYPNLASTVLYLEAVEDEDVVVLDADGRQSVQTINRKLRILKCRNGRGDRMVIGLSFDKHTLRTAEAGVILNIQATQQRSTASNRGKKLRQSPNPSEDSFAEGKASG